MKDLIEAVTKRQVEAWRLVVGGYGVTWRGRVWI